MYGSVEQAFVGRDEPKNCKNGCEGGYRQSFPSSLRKVPNDRFGLHCFRDLVTRQRRDDGGDYIF